MDSEYLLKQIILLWIKLKLKMKSETSDPDFSDNQTKFRVINSITCIHQRDHNQNKLISQPRSMMSNYPDLNAICHLLSKLKANWSNFVNIDFIVLYNEQYGQYFYCFYYSFWFLQVLHINSLLFRACLYRNLHFLDHIGYDCCIIYYLKRHVSWNQFIKKN